MGDIEKISKQELEEFREWKKQKAEAPKPKEEPEQNPETPKPKEDPKPNAPTDLKIEEEPPTDQMIVAAKKEKETGDREYEYRCESCNHTEESNNKLKNCSVCGTPFIWD
ncbi:MAG: hypothetical protein IH845_05130 [Nanoarchaeota archaeon]|nr:hypothetical protein [Nanoarchaeota archaeon]